MMEDKTLRWQGGSPEAEETLRMDCGVGEEKTRLYSGNPDTTAMLPGSSPGAYELNGSVYRIVRVISESSGEAQIYEIENGGQHYVLKLYYPNCSPKKGLLEVVRNMDFEMIVKIFDYGTVTLGTSVRTFEIMEYLEGGSLEEYPFDKDPESFRKIAFSGAAALYFCHRNGIIHKDIKPGNFFFRDREHRQLVLGDFGISSLCEDTDLLHKTTQARTPVYAAPEMYVNVIDGETELTAAVDFYSLGITLLYLWYGKNPFFGNERSMMRMKMEGKLPGLEELPSGVNRIIRGLTVVDASRRWGYPEVEKWFQGEKVEVYEGSPLLKYTAFVFDPEKHQVAVNAKELAVLLSENKKLGIRYLYGKKIEHWLEECGNIKLALELGDIVEKRFPMDQEAGIWAAVYTLDQAFPFLYPQGADTISAIIETFARGEGTGDQWKSLVDGRLLIWLSGKNEPLLVREIEALTKGQAFSMGLAYGVLYYLDRRCGYDLKTDTSREEIAGKMEIALQEAQYLTEEELAVRMEEFIGRAGKLTFYCKAHRWQEILDFREQCLNLHAKEYKERYGEYNLRIACYKFCSGLGHVPGYLCGKEGIKLDHPDDLKKISSDTLKQELQQGSLKAWLTLFFHENTGRTFERPCEYEKALEAYLNFIGQYDPGDYYYSRFDTARKQIKEKSGDLRRTRMKLRGWEIAGMLLLGISGGSLAVLIVFYGFSNIPLFSEVAFYVVGIPLGITGFVLSVRWAWFSGYGFIMGMLISLGGCLLWVAPVSGMGWLMKLYPEHTLPIVMITLALYVVVFYIQSFRHSVFRQKNLSIFWKEDVKLNLLEPLYFAYKSATVTFRASNLKLLNESMELLREIRNWGRVHYVIWILLLWLFIAGFVYFHPAWYNAPIPDVAWKNKIESLDINEYINKITGDKE